MVNYNFSIGVALDLQSFDIFTDREYPEFGYSSYDANICNNTLSFKVPQLSICFTIHDNGKISMCSKEQEIDAALNNLQVGYDTFYMVLEDFREQKNLTEFTG